MQPEKWKPYHLPQELHRVIHERVMNMKTCSKEGCEANARANGLCSRHYQAYKRHGDTNRAKCEVSGCDKNAIVLNMCNKHYSRYRKSGVVNTYSFFEPNQIIDNIDGTHSIVLKDRYGNKQAETIIDSDKISIVIRYKWHLNSSGYAATNINGDTKRIHEIIFPVPKGFFTDHVDRCPLNNRLSNLRVATFAENRINSKVWKNSTSGVTGVLFCKRQSIWISRIQINKNPIFLGRFANKEDAIKVRLHAEKKYFGEFAPQQHLYEQYGIDRRNA